jgi:hypothetical protein
LADGRAVMSGSLGIKDINEYTSDHFEIHESELD